MNLPDPPPQANEAPAAQAVVVHSLEHAVAALMPGMAVTLLSAPGAASYGGPLWWRCVVDAARTARPETPCDDILDCADAPGLAMAALRLGQRHLILWAECPASGPVAAAAGLLGAVVLTTRPPALDLAARGAHRRLAAWLAAKSAH